MVQLLPNSQEHLDISLSRFFFAESSSGQDVYIVVYYGNHVPCIALCHWLRRLLFTRSQHIFCHCAPQLFR